MSNVKRMEIWTAVRTVLEKNPGLSAKFLIKELREKTGLNRSTIYEHLGSFALRKKIFREKGKYWLEKPQGPDERNLERIRNETEKIKKDYFQGRRHVAFERMLLLGATLPKDWKKELELMMTESKKTMKKIIAGAREMGIKIRMKEGPLLDPTMIPEILIKLHQLIESYEQGSKEK